MTSKHKNTALWVIGSIIVAALVGLAIYFAYRFYQQTRGIISDSNNDTMNTDTSAAPDYRNSGISDYGIVDNNPGNLTYNGEHWHGLAGQNGRFMVFINMWYGLRALGLDITNKIKTYGSIQNYVPIYAPASDGNNTAAYIAYISNAVGLPASAVPPLNNATIAKLIRAHCEQENSKELADQYISDDDIQQGIALITDEFGNPLYPQSA